MLSKLYMLAVYSGVVFHRLKLPASLFNRIQCYSMFLRLLNFVLTYGNELEWLGKNQFVDQLGIPFRLCIKNFWWLNSYFKNKSKIKLWFSNRKLYAKCGGLSFHIPSLASVMVLAETFLENTYGAFNVKNRTVLDVGAFIGDTAVYFAHEGANRVVAYEPVPLFFELAKENVSLNGYTSVVEMVNMAVGGKESVSQNMVSFKSVVERLGHIDLLKMDCEGMEWQIILVAVKDGSLERVDMVIMEVHGGSCERMEALLRKIKFQITKRVIYGKNGGLIAAVRER